MPLKVCLEQAGPSWARERPSDLEMMRKYHVTWLSRAFTEVVWEAPDCDVVAACAYTAYVRDVAFRDASGRELFTAYAKFTGVQAAGAKNRIIEELIARFRPDGPLYQSVKRERKTAPALAAKPIAPPPSESAPVPAEAVAVAASPAPPPEKAPETPAEKPKPKKRAPLTEAEERAIDAELLP